MINFDDDKMNDVYMEEFDGYDELTDVDFIPPDCCNVYTFDTIDDDNYNGYVEWFWDTYGDDIYDEYSQWEREAYGRDVRYYDYGIF